MIFLENQFNSLYRIDFKGFCNIILEFINYGPEIYKMLLFACLSITNTGRICEHDLYSIMDNFKQRKGSLFPLSFVSSTEAEVGDLKDKADDSDSTFFQAFVQDIL